MPAKIGATSISVSVGMSIALVMAFTSNDTKFRSDIDVSTEYFSIGVT